MGYRDIVKTATIEPERSFNSVVPKGRYLCELKNAEEKISKEGKPYLKFDWIIFDGGEYDSWHLFPMISHETERGAGLLKQLSEAVGLPDGFDELYELHDRKAILSVYVMKSKDPAYPDDRNGIGGYYAATDASVVVGSKARVPVAQPKGKGNVAPKKVEQGEIPFDEDNLPF